MKKQFYRVKQLADQTFSRSGKSEALSDELQTADRKVENFRNALNLISKRLSTGAGSTQGQDPAAREKRLKKLPEYMLGLSLCEASNFDDEESIFKFILHECGKTEKYLANEIAEHELKVEQLVCAPLSTIIDQDLPVIMKAKKHLSRLISEKESAANKYNHIERQIDQNPAKLSAARDEYEEAATKVDAARDSLAADMFALVAKEAPLANILLQYVKLQRAYHENALHSLQDTVPELERIIHDSAVKPVFGYPLEEHLRVATRTIAFPIELCVCMLHELALNEEGVFRIAGSTTKVRRMKLSLDAGLFNVPVPREYRDVHVIASVLKSYLRELPEPLLTYRMYESFIAASRQPTEQARLNSLWEAIHLLPDANFQNLRYLIKFLSALTKNQIRNKMTPSNLAIVIAPNLLWAADESTFDMNITTAINCVVESLIRHADWFYSDDVNFFITLTKEDVVPEHCDYGFTSNFGPGYTQTAALAQENSNGDFGSMSKSMYDSGQTSKTFGKSNVDTPGRHSRSNSHDTSLILLENEMKKAQSSSSLSDQSSPPHGSPKPVTRRKNKPLAPVPPSFTPDKHRNSETQTEHAVKTDVDKPAKPPRPIVSDTGKVISGVQTINRSTYRQSKMSRDKETATGSRENLCESRRQSLDFEADKPEQREAAMVVKSVTAQTGVAGRMKVSGEVGKLLKPTVQPPPRPVAAPRTILPAPCDDTSDVSLRNKPAVPERPAALRPHSFRGARGSLEEAPPTVLERAHVYSVDKQHPTVIEVGETRPVVHRTHSSGGGDADETRALCRQTSQSEGSITDGPVAPLVPPAAPTTPAAPVEQRARPQRPQVPAPPPPVHHESTDL